MDAVRLKELFLEESRLQLDAAFEQFDTLLQTDRPAVAIGALLRSSHSLKGMAATMGYAPMVELAHALEDRFEAMRDAGSGPNETQRDACRTALALLAEMIDEAVDGAPSRRDEAQPIIARLRKVDEPNREAPLKSRISPSQSKPIHEMAWRVECSLDDEDPPRSAIRTLERLATLGTVRTVHPPRIGGGSSAARYRIQVTLLHEGPLSRLETELEATLGETTTSIEPEAPYGVVTSETPAKHGWSRVRTEDMEQAFSGVRELLQRRDGPLAAENIRRIAGGVYETMQQMRLIEFSEIATRLRATVQRAASESGKQAHLEIEGGDGRLDQSCLEALIPSLQHLLRNAVAHGIESPRRRRELGKPAAGTLVVNLLRRERRWQLTVHDDGQGIKLDLLRRLGVERGLLEETEAATTPAGALRDLVFHPNFSSRTEVDTLSGRGVGLDAVRHGIESIGGHVNWNSTPGTFTEFVCNFPQQASLLPSLIVKSAGSHYAFPLDAIDRVIDRKEVMEQHLPSKDLQELVTPDSEPRTVEGKYAVVVHHSTDPLAIVVDEIIGHKELLTQPVGLPLSRLKPYSYFSTLEDGNVVVVIDPPNVAGRMWLHGQK